MLARFFDRVTRLALRWQWPTIILTVIILAAGVWSLTGLNLELLPSVEFPQTVVVAQWSEAETPQAFLDEVTVPLEEALSAVPGVVNVESTTTTALAFIVVRNEFGLSQQRVLEHIEEAVADVAYPEGMEIPQVLNFSFSDLPVVTASVSSGELSLAELKALVDAELVPSLRDLEDVSEVALSGGQELPEADTAVAEVPATMEEPTPSPTAVPEPTATPDPARLPEELSQGAAMLGLTVEVASDLTPDLIRQLTGFGPMATQALASLTPDNLRRMPAESLALLPADYLTTLDPALRAELDELAAEFGGAGALAAAESVPTDADVPDVEPVSLPENWVAAGASQGLTLVTTADVSGPVMQGVAAAAPELLAALEPSMWRALPPDALAQGLPAAAEALEPLLVAQLQAILAAAQGEPPPPVALPESWIAATAAAGQALSTTAEISAPALGLIAGNAPALLDDLTDEIVLGLSTEVQAALPPEVVAGLTPGTRETLGIIETRALQMAAGEEDGPPVVEEPADPTRLPQEIIDLLGSFGIPLESTGDVTPDFMRLLAGLGPQAGQLLSLLTPDNLRALEP
jgi:hypothetical protein